MAINNWWEGDPSERYWMEITDRVDLGDDLRAPKTNATGGESWSYTLTSYVQPGDIVFHWHRTLAGEPALVGWSEAVGPLESFTMSWQAKGSAGRARGIPTTGEAWRVPLRNFTRFDEAFTRTAVNERRAEILSALAETAATVGAPIYAPFQDYGGRELRAQQGYLVKFPAALVPLLLKGEWAAPAASSPGSSRTSPTVRSQGYLADAAVRTALERHSVAIARAHYTDAGATGIEELGKPFDLRVLLDGVERHVEVKGSTGIGLDSVQLTQGEVDHANRHQPTDLFVVEQIEVARSDDGEILTAGGVTRLWLDWVPAANALRSTHLRYTLPNG